MKQEEERKMLDLLAAVDLMTSESHKPAPLRKLVKVMEMPDPTVYSYVDRAVRYGLVSKAQDEGGYRAVTITLKGYRLLGKGVKGAPVESPKPQERAMSYKQAYILLSQLFMVSEAIGASERRAIKEGLDRLLS